jgi:DNA-binding FrmR family transcriptional regulator
MGYEADTESREKLGHRLNRVIGQLQSLQKRVVAGGSDCVGDIQQLKAANNALWKVAESLSRDSS